MSKKKRSTRAEQREALREVLRRESERDQLEQIRRQLAAPLEERMNFLRVRLPNGGSVL